MKRYSTQRIATALAILILLDAPNPIEAFIIPVHERITRAALEDHSADQIPAKEKGWIVEGSVAADLMEGGIYPLGDISYDARFHFDNDLDYPTFMTNYLGMLRLIDGVLGSKVKNQATCVSFGKLLHSIEDFYAHSNYVELYLEYNKKTSNDQLLSVPTFEQVELDKKRYGQFLSFLKNNLRTGRYPDRWYPSRIDHGSPLLPYSIGLNQDSMGRPHFYGAQETADYAATWYVQVFTGDKKARQQWVQLKASLGAKR